MGDIVLIAERRGPRFWYPSAIGWLGIEMWRGDGHADRLQAQQAVISWFNHTHNEENEDAY